MNQESKNLKDININKEKTKYPKNLDEKSIYNYINKINQETKNKENTLKKQEKRVEKYAKIISSISVSVILYLLCIIVAQIPLPEIIDLELPLLIFISLIITGLNIQGFSKYTTICSIILTCLIYVLHSGFAIIIFLPLIAYWIVQCIENINKNEHDFKIEENGEIK